MVQAQDRRQGRGRDDRRRGPRRDRPGDDFVEKVVTINRVAKVVKGGRRFSFTAVMVVGDGNGRVGIGMGRANEVPEAIRKGATIARRNMITVPIRNGTIPHPLTTDFGAARVMLKPASAGTGVIAGGGVRAIMEAAGVRNVLTKSLGSNNVINVVRATMVGLEKLRDPRRVRQERLRLAGLIPAEELADPTTTGATEDAPAASDEAPAPVADAPVADVPVADAPAAETTTPPPAAAPAVSAPPPATTPPVAAAPPTDTPAIGAPPTAITPAADAPAVGSPPTVITPPIAAPPVGAPPTVAAPADEPPADTAATPPLPESPSDPAPSADAPTPQPPEAG